MGFKKTSDLIAISFTVIESAANTFTQDEIALQLDVLNNEIFVVLAVDLNPSAPEMITATNTETQALVTSTSQTAMTHLGNTNTIAVASLSIQSDAVNAVGFTRAAEESYSANLDYVSLIATNNFFVAIEGTNNTAARNVTGRVWGYRAKADSSTYAALVQSEVLSA
ncbi:unnamed protein product [marine sediment metagenome]|uniref:Uncharacterized protein n=1 Tax=marine sediment metagenome TaxID=412755 RepID=X0ZPG7_9ZZZZ